MKVLPMKVLIVSHAHPAFSIGGAQAAAYSLFNGLNRLADCECHFLAHVGPPTVPHRDTPFLSLRQGPRELLYFSKDYDYFYLSNRDLPTLSRHFARYLADLAPDIVHFHHFLGFGMESVQVVRQILPRARIVVTLHEYLSICNNHGQMVKTKQGLLCSSASPAECALCFPHISAGHMLRRELFIKSFFEDVDVFVSPSHFLLGRFKAWGLPPEKLMMLENGLEPMPVAPPRPLARGGRRSRFAFFGQLNPFKGIKVLVEAVGRVPAEIWGDDAVLNVYGGNLEVQPEAFQQEFKRLVTAAGRRIRFFGSYKAHELPDLMRETDWVIVPSTWWENAPVVIEEAFYHGRPVICSDIGGMAEKVRNRIDGLHFRVGSAESLVDRLIEALTHPELWERLRSRARKPLMADGAAEQHLSLYRRLLTPADAAQPAQSAAA
jgi:glycosyltransferase involved in cell wall biosynthesis